MSNSNLPIEVEDKLKVYRAVQADIQKIFASKQQLLSQFNENTLVQGELDLLEEGNSVFKLVGPALVTVELDEAKENVKKRLEFIEGEIKKTDNQIDAKNNELKKLGDEVTAIQQRMQADAVAAARQVVSEVTN